MLNRIIDWSLAHRPLVLFLSALLVVGGGYSLTRPPEDINLWEIIAALDSHTTLVDCVLEPEISAPEEVREKMAES